MSQPKLKVFVSYSRVDILAADGLVASLEERGVEVVIDRRDLPYGEEWQVELGDFDKAPPMDGLFDKAPYLRVTGGK